MQKTYNVEPQVKTFLIATMHDGVELVVCVDKHPTCGKLYWLNAYEPDGSDALAELDVYCEGYTLDELKVDVEQQYQFEGIAFNWGAVTC